MITCNNGHTFELGPIGECPHCGSRYISPEEGESVSAYNFADLPGELRSIEIVPTALLYGHIRLRAKAFGITTFSSGQHVEVDLSFFPVGDQDPVEYFRAIAEALRKAAYDVDVEADKVESAREVAS